MLQREEMDTGNQYRTSAGTGRFLHSRKFVTSPLGQSWAFTGILGDKRIRDLFFIVLGGAAPGHPSL